MKAVSYAIGKMGEDDVSYLTKARAEKLIQELTEEKTRIEARIAKLQTVKRASYEAEAPKPNREESLKAARQKSRK